MKFIKKYAKLLIVFLLLIVLILSGIFIMNNRNPYRNEGFKGFYYRTYANGKWSKWCKNGEVCGKKGSAITDIEIKTGDNIKGLMYYNVYHNGNFAGLNSVDQKLLDNTSNIEALLLTSSGEMLEKYNIYYRTYNAKYGWLAYSYGDQLIAGESGINGAKGFPMEQIQIIILARDSKTKINFESSNNASYDFNEDENTEEQAETQEETENTENVE